MSELEPEVVVDYASLEELPTDIQTELSLDPDAWIERMLNG